MSVRTICQFRFMSKRNRYRIRSQKLRSREGETERKIKQHYVYLVRASHQEGGDKERERECVWKREREKF